MNQPKKTIRRRTNRRGTIYVVALGVGLLLTVISLGALAAVRSLARSRERSHDATDARNYALSAIEVGRRLIATDSNWRNDYSNGMWISHQSLGAGSYSLQGVDPNGTLNNADNDPVVLTGRGNKGLARQLLSVTLIANTTPLSCLGVGSCTTGSANFNGATIQGTSAFSVGSTLTCTNTSFNGNNLEALAIVSAGCTGMGTQTVLAAARTMPSSTAFNYYTSHGTAITYSSTGNTLQNCLLSPTSNPYGSQTNSQGIYIIDCGGQNITIKNMRLVGTLVLLNTGAASSITGSVNMAPAVSNFPALLVSGPMQFTFTNSALSEGTIGINLNPPGTPYNGVSNATTTDSYPSIIQGLIYVSGNVTCNGNVTIKGVVLTGGTLGVQGTLSLTYDPTFYNKPPPGFYLTPPPMIVSPGTWTQVVN